jgi:hypothetical protein
MLIRHAAAMAFHGCRERSGYAETIKLTLRQKFFRSAPLSGITGSSCLLAANRVILVVDRLLPVLLWNGHRQDRSQWLKSAANSRHSKATGIRD